MQSKLPLMTTEKNIKSPCINLCRLDEFNVCIGCKRHIDEIAEWSRMGYEEKLKIVQRTQNA
jgi:predicted Fe-S protein YdhL (DUF1289 family)